MEVRVPATLIDCELPKLVSSHDAYVLDRRIFDLSDLVRKEFKEDNGCPPKNPDGRLPGWDGEYLFAVDWKERLNLNDIDFKTTKYVALNDKPELAVLPVKVSLDLASSHYYSDKDGNQDNNPICCLGSYIVPVVLDGSGRAVLLVATRPESAFLRPGRFDSTGAAIPVNGDTLNYLGAMASKLSEKHKVRIDPIKVKPLGIITDNVINYLLPSGWTFVYEEDVSADCELRAVPLREFEDFVSREAPIERWNYPAFMALCETIYRIGIDINDIDLMNMGRRTIAEQYGKLKNNSLQERSVLQDLKIL